MDDTYIAVQLTVVGIMKYKNVPVELVVLELNLRIVGYFLSHVNIVVSEVKMWPLFPFHSVLRNGNWVINLCVAVTNTAPLPTSAMYSLTRTSERQIHRLGATHARALRCHVTFVS